MANVLVAMEIENGEHTLVLRPLDGDGEERRIPLGDETAARAAVSRLLAKVREADEYTVRKTALGDAWMSGRVQ